MKEKLESNPIPEGPSTKWREAVEREQWVRTDMGTDPWEEKKIAENREIMDARMEGLGELMKDANFWWQLDGGMNISVSKGEYDRVHADIDISLMEEDLERAEAYLAERGYGFFITYARENPGEDFARAFRRIGAKALAGATPLTDIEKTRKKLGDRIVAFDKKTGEIRNDAGLVSMDLSLVGRDEEGHYIGRMGIVMPDEWMEGKEAVFKTQNKEIPFPLSHPARFIFNKLFFGRDHDRKDIKKYAGMGALTLHDVDEIERVATDCFEKEGTFSYDDNEARRKLVTGRIAYAKETLVTLRQWVAEAR